MHQNAFGGRAPPGPAGGAKALPQTPSPNNGGLLLRGGEGTGGKGRRGEREGEGKGRGEGREREGKGRGGRDLAPRKKFLAPPLGLGLGLGFVKVLSCV